MNSLLFFITILIMMFSTIETQQLTELKYGSGPIRSITKLRNGIILGGRCSDHEIEIWVSPNQGLTWLRIGSVANKKDVEFGDLMFLTIPNTSVVYCAFRERNLAGQYSVVVYRSDNDGKDWVYDSTVISGQSQFVGAPWLFLAQNGDLQCNATMIQNHCLQDMVLKGVNGLQCKEEKEGQEIGIIMGL